MHMYTHDDRIPIGHPDTGQAYIDSDTWDRCTSYQIKEIEHWLWRRANIVGEPNAGLTIDTALAEKILGCSLLSPNETTDQD